MARTVDIDYTMTVAAADLQNTGGLQAELLKTMSIHLSPHGEALGSVHQGRQTEFL